MSKNVLVAYASVSGSTGEVAQAIGEVLGKAGAVVQVSPTGRVDDLAGYDAVVLGSSIRAGKWLPEAFYFLETHEEGLGQLTVAYFTTCLTMVDDTEENRRTVLAYMEPVRQAAPDIEPVGLGLFAGSLDPQRRLVMPAGGPQGDYRNWAAIRDWAKEICPTLLGEEIRPDEPPVLSKAKLSYTDLSGADLHGADLQEADLHGANLHGADLHEADLHQADLHEADLHQADLHGADLVETDLHEANLHQADLQEVSLNWADLNWADIRGADLQRANLIGVDLKQADLHQAKLTYATLNGANLSEATLSEADLSHADLNWADLRGANLSHANLSGANLGWANLSRADLTGVNLKEAKYNWETEWPEDFSPAEHGGILIESGVH